MQTFQFTSPGVIATYQTVWTGDAEGDGICYSYSYNGCCQQGMEMRLTHTDVNGNNLSTNTIIFGITANCYITQSNISFIISGAGTQRRLTMVELRIRSANLCPEDTLVDVKLTVDMALICISSNCCNVSNDYREVF